MSGYSKELKVAIAAAREAAAAIMAVFLTVAVKTKPDGSYVTEADLASDAIIRRALLSSFPADGILTEEGVDDPARLTAERCWIVDPIDGTSSFVGRGTELDVYIALVVDHRPVLAVSLQPPTGLLLTAIEGGGTWLSEASELPRRVEIAPAPSPIRLGTRTWLGSPGNLNVLQSVADRMEPSGVVFDSPDPLGSRSLLRADRQIDAMIGVSVKSRLLDAWEWISPSWT